MQQAYQNYINNITPTIKAMINKLEKLYPGISTRPYPDPGKYDSNSTIGERIEMVLYIELMRMGINPCAKARKV